MDALEKWMIIQHTQYPNHHPTKMDVLPKTLFKSSLLINGWCGIQESPPTNTDGRPLPSLLSLSFFHGVTIQMLAWTVS